MLNPETERELQRQRAKKVRQAEERTGFKEGGFVWNSKPVKVEVQFYPREKWYITVMDTTGSGENAKRQELTPGIWAECHQLRLTDD